MVRIQLFSQPNDHTPNYAELERRVQTDVFDKIWSDRQLSYAIIARRFDLKEATVRSWIKDAERILKRIVYQPSASEFLAGAYQMTPVNHYLNCLERTQHDLSTAFTRAVPEIPVNPDLSEAKRVTLGIEALGLKMGPYNRLMRQTPIRTIHDLLHQSERSIIAIRYLSKPDAYEILAYLFSYCDTYNIDPNNYPIRATPKEEPLLQSVVAKDSTVKPLSTGHLTDSIEVIDPSTRARKALDKWNVNTIHDLLLIPHDYVEKTRNIGIKTRNALLDELYKWSATHTVDIHSYPFIPHNEDRLNDSIETLGLNKRTLNALYNNGIVTINQVLLTPELALLNMHSIGKKSTEHLFERLAKWSQHYYIKLDNFPLYN